MPNRRFWKSEYERLEREHAELKAKYEQLRRDHSDLKKIIEKRLAS